MKKLQEITPAEQLSKWKDIALNGLLQVDNGVEGIINVEENCLGISYTPNDGNGTNFFTLLPLDCDDRKSVVCKLSVDEIANLTSSTKPAKFPCIPNTQEARKKRYDGQDPPIDPMREYSETGEFIVNWKCCIKFKTYKIDRFFS